jgi:hypothetical protein
MQSVAVTLHVPTVHGLEVAAADDHYPTESVVSDGAANAFGAGIGTRSTYRSADDSDAPGA